MKRALLAAALVLSFAGCSSSMSLEEAIAQCQRECGKRGWAVVRIEQRYPHASCTCREEQP